MRFGKEFVQWTIPVPFFDLDRNKSFRLASLDPLGQIIDLLAGKTTASRSVDAGDLFHYHLARHLSERDRSQASLVAGGQPAGAWRRRTDSRGSDIQASNHIT